MAIADRSLPSTGPKCPATEMFASFLAARGGVGQGSYGQSISLRAGSRARTSATPAGVPGLAERVQDFGRSLPGSFAFFDPLTFSWRMFQRSLFEGGYPEFSEIW